MKILKKTNILFKDELRTNIFDCGYNNTNPGCGCDD